MDMEFSGGRNFSFGDREVDFFDHGIHSLINFEFKESAKGPYEKLFSSYSDRLHNELSGVGILNYLSSHDDGGPFDKHRERALEAGTKLLLSPGACQVYYGDESCRPLDIPGTYGDATLRSRMNWEEIASNETRNGVAVGESPGALPETGRVPQGSSGGGCRDPSNDFQKTLFLFKDL
jgi:alpha-amylase